ncbi:unnamed protein product [Nesidiocoris tenuis]|uniref:Uncharacterized protein n=1 Tax=Nesidiocoris tenuis TaxID=355587 RepID=A0A6H5GAG8_9HEMI|nr:unnamed protein product [Nesidiocoris tenuis]
MRDRVTTLEIPTFGQKHFSDHRQQGADCAIVSTCSRRQEDFLQYSTVGRDHVKCSSCFLQWESAMGRKPDVIWRISVTKDDFRVTMEIIATATSTWNREKSRNTYHRYDGDRSGGCAGGFETTSTRGDPKAHIPACGPSTTPSCPAYAYPCIQKKRRRRWRIPNRWALSGATWHYLLFESAAASSRASWCSKSKIRILFKIYDKQSASTNKLEQGVRSRAMYNVVTAAGHPKLDPQPIVRVEGRVKAEEDEAQKWTDGFVSSRRMVPEEDGGGELMSD